MRGLFIEINDVVLHADSIHRGAGQIMPPMKRAIFGCQIASGPRLMEPMFICDIQVAKEGVSGVYNTLSQRRGEVVDEKSDDHKCHPFPSTGHSEGEEDLRDMVGG